MSLPDSLNSAGDLKGQASGTLGKSDPPPAPNYFGAAVGQGGANIQSAIANYLLSNPNQVTPYGTLQSTQSGSFNIPGMSIPGVGQIPDMTIPTFTKETNFTPEGQARFDQGQRISDALGNLAESGLDRVGAAQSQPFGFGSADELQDKAEKALMSRLTPIMDRQEDALRTRLANQGIGIGSEAYNKDIEAFGRGRNDATMQAILQAYQTRPQTIQEEAYLRSQPLNELNSLRTGSAVQMPQFQQPFALGVQPGNIAGAASQAGQYDVDVWNAQQARNNQLFNLGGNLGLYSFGLPPLFGK